MVVHSLEVPLERPFNETFAAPLALNPTAIVANMSARRLKRPVNRTMKDLPRVVVGRDPKKSTPRTMLGAFDSGKDMAAIEEFGAYFFGLGTPDTHE